MVAVASLIVADEIVVVVSSAIAALGAAGAAQAVKHRQKDAVRDTSIAPTSAQQCKNDDPCRDLEDKYKAALEKRYEADRALTEAGKEVERCTNLYKNAGGLGGDRWTTTELAKADQKLNGLGREWERRQKIRREAEAALAKCRSAARR